MLDQAVLDLGWTNAVTRDLEDVVDTSLIPEVAVPIHRGNVTGATPVAGELLLRPFRIVEVLEKEHRIGYAVGRDAVHGDVTVLAAWHLLAVLVDDSDPMTGVGRPIEPGFASHSECELPTCSSFRSDRTSR